MCVLADALLTNASLAIVEYEATKSRSQPTCGPQMQIFYVSFRIVDAATIQDAVMVNTFLVGSQAMMLIKHKYGHGPWCKRLQWAVCVYCTSVDGKDDVMFAARIFQMVLQSPQPHESQQDSSEEKQYAQHAGIT